MEEHLRTCHLCEAHCGLVISTDGPSVRRVRGDLLDHASRGHLCPKASGLKWLAEDPDVVRRPLIREGSSFREVTWPEAFAEADRVLGPIVAEHGPNAIGVYFGNPASHCLSLGLYSPHLMRLTRSRWSPGPVDTFPKQLANGLMYGGEFTIPVPDIDRTELIWILGANPVASNGSFMVAPRIADRLRAISARGGRVVVFDPRRTPTAKLADEHHAIRPGTDALLLAAVVNVIVGEGLTRLDHLTDHVERLDVLAGCVRRFTPDRVAGACGMDAAEIVRLARELAATPRAVVYGRIGTATQEFGTLASWLVEALNVITGNLDRPGGSMFSWPVTGSAYTVPGPPRLPRRNRFRSRVSDLPEVLGELPSGCLAEEILEPGPGQVLGMITLAGNPVSSLPDPRLDAAFAQLRALVSVDIYVNETSRHAALILPSEPHLEQPHFAFGLQRQMIQQIAKWSEPVFPPDPDRPRDWEIVLRLRSILQGRGADIDVVAADDRLFAEDVSRLVRTEGSPIHSRRVDEIASLTSGVGPERMSDLLIRTGPYGDAYGARPGGLTLDAVRADPRGIDLGGLQPHVPDMLRTPTGRIDLAPADLVADVERLEARLAQPRSPLMMIGRRELRSNNSWMNNLPGLARGRDRSRLHVNPADAAARSLHDGDVVTITSRGGSVDVAIELTDDVMPGVVCLPHGRGQRSPALSVASVRPGVNSNLLADVELLDVPSGASVVNGLPVEIVRAAVPAATGEGPAGSPAEESAAARA